MHHCVCTAVPGSVHCRLFLSCLQQEGSRSCLQLQEELRSVCACVPAVCARSLFTTQIMVLLILSITESFHLVTNTAFLCFESGQCSIAAGCACLCSILLSAMLGSAALLCALSVRVLSAAGRGGEGRLCARAVCNSKMKHKTCSSQRMLLCARNCLVSLFKQSFSKTTNHDGCG